jgi:hypothetical protein
VQLAPRIVEARLPRAAVEVRNGQAMVVRKRLVLYTDERVQLGATDDLYVEVHGIERGALVRLP